MIDKLIAEAQALVDNDFSEGGDCPIIDVKDALTVLIHNSVSHDSDISTDDIYKFLSDYI